MPTDPQVDRRVKSRRTRLAPAVRRELLLDVAMKLFERHAYDVVTLERIAEQAGVSPALVHHYFGTKREVFLGVVDRAIAGFQVAVSPPPDAARASPNSPRTALKAALERYLDFVLERPNGYAFVIGAHGTPDEHVSQSINTAREAVHRTVLAIVGISKPTLQQDLAMWGWLGFTERATTRWVDHGHPDRPAFIELLLRAATPILASPRARG